MDKSSDNIYEKIDKTILENDRYDVMHNFDNVSDFISDNTFEQVCKDDCVLYADRYYKGNIQLVATDD